MTGSLIENDKRCSECLARGMCMARALIEPQLSEWSGALTRITVPQGQAVIKEGAPLDKIYIVQMGCFLSHTSEYQKNSAVNIKNAGGQVVLRLSTFVPFLLSILCIAVIVLLIHSSYGRAFKAIRDDEVAAEAMGISLFKHKMLSFVISSFFSGVGGALFAMYVSNAQAKAFTSTMTYEILLIVVIGGIGSISGSVIGTFLYVACSEWWLRFLDAETYIGSFKVPLLRSGFRMVVFSVVIMIIVLFFSQGIMGEKELSWAGIGGLLKKIKPKKKAASAGKEG